MDFFDICWNKINKLYISYLLYGSSHTCSHVQNILNWQNYHSNLFIYLMSDLKSFDKTKIMCIIKCITKWIFVADSNYSKIYIVKDYQTKM